MSGILVHTEKHEAENGDREAATLADGWKKLKSGAQIIPLTSCTETLDDSCRSYLDSGTASVF